MGLSSKSKSINRSETEGGSEEPEQTMDREPSQSSGSGGARTWSTYRLTSIGDVTGLGENSPRGVGSRRSAREPRPRDVVVRRSAEPGGNHRALQYSETVQMNSALEVVLNIAMVTNLTRDHNGRYVNETGQRTYDLMVSMDNLRMCTVVYYDLWTCRTRRRLVRKALHIHWVKRTDENVDPEGDPPSFTWKAIQSVVESRTAGLMNQGLGFENSCCREWLETGIEMPLEE